jgi:tetratricopeptide (TPR) repeat protein
VLSLAGRLIHQQLNYAAARSLLEQALNIARASGDKKEIAFDALWLGRTALHHGDDQTAQQLIQESFTLYQELEEEWGVAMAFSFLAELALDRGDYSWAKEVSTKSLAKFQAIGDGFRAEQALVSLGEVARLEGQYEHAAAFYEQALEILRNLRSGRRAPAIALCNLAWVWLHKGDNRKANDCFSESLKLYREGGEKIGILDCLSGFAACLGMSGKPEQAARLFGALETLPESLGLTWVIEPADQKEFDHYLAAARGQLDEAAFTKAWAEGSRMSLDQAIDFALQETQI